MSEQQVQLGDDGEIINDLLRWDLSWDHQVWEDGEIGAKQKRSSLRVRLGDSSFGKLFRLLVFGAAVWGCAWSLGLSYVAFRSIDLAQCPVQVWGMDVRTGRIAFASAREGTYNVYVMDADGFNRRRQRRILAIFPRYYPLMV